MTHDRILHVVDKLAYSSGVASIVLNYAQCAKRYTFDFMLNEEPPEDVMNKISGWGGSIYVAPHLHMRQGYKYVRAVNEFFKTHKEYQIIHGHVANAAVAYMNAAKRNGIQYRILHCHSSKGADTPIKQVRNYALNKMGVRAANRYAACSKVAAEYLFGKKPDVTIFHNAIDIDKYTFDSNIRTHLRKELGLEGKLVIGNVGRMTPVKNQVFLLSVLAIVLKRLPDSTLLITGDGYLHETLEHRAAELGIADRVSLIGETSQANELYSVMDIFALPSIFEGLPVTGIEAQANGLPCIISDTVTREVKITDNCSFLPINDPDLWVDEIIRIYKKGRVDVDKELMAEYDIEIQGERLEEYYDRLWKNR